MEAVEVHLQAAALHSFVAERSSARRAPLILRRNLSYLDRSNRGYGRGGEGHVLELQLDMAGPGEAGNGAAGVPANGLGSGSGGSSGQDILIAALCVEIKHAGEQAFMPVAARALPLPQAPAVLAFTLPFEGNLWPSSCLAITSGLSVVLIHHRSSQQASLLALASWERSRSSWRQAAAGKGGKALALDITATSAFQLIASGAQVRYSILPLDDLLLGGAGFPSNGGWQRQRVQLQGPLRRVEGVLTTHLPAAVGSSGDGGEGAAGPASFLPCMKLRQEQQGERKGPGAGRRSCSRDGRPAQFLYKLRLAPAGGSLGSAGGEQQQLEGRKQGPGAGSAFAGSKRKADAALTEAAAPGDAATAGAKKQRAAPQQQQGTQQQEEQQVTFFFSSFTGSCTAHGRLLGFHCPHASCHAMCCHSYAGLQQHMWATHSYHSYHFSDVMPDGGLEVHLRCKPGWCDPHGRFLPRQLSSATVEGQPLHTLLVITPISLLFMYQCPRGQRRLRQAGAWGLNPRDEEQEDEEARLAAEVAEEEDEEAPSGSMPISSSRAAAAAAEAAAIAAAVAARRGKAAAGAAAGRGRGGRKQAAAHVRRQGMGLALLNHNGRPKYYHRHTCIAMTHEELMGGDGGVDSDSERELQEWKRDCQVRLKAVSLAESRELCAEERQFMFEWALWEHLHPIHADIDMPAAVAAFCAAHAHRLASDAPFRHCLTVYLLNLWRFRLLTPQQLHTLNAGLPTFAALPAADTATAPPTP